MRRAARVDANQPDIIKAFRAGGATVAVTSNQHSGFPDLTIGYLRYTVLVEVKDGSKPPSARQLTPAQKQFHGDWKGDPIRIIASVEEALDLLKELQARKAHERTHFTVNAK